MVTSKRVRRTRLSICSMLQYAPKMLPTDPERTVSARNHGISGSARTVEKGKAGKGRLGGSSVQQRKTWGKGTLSMSGDSHGARHTALPRPWLALGIEEGEVRSITGHPTLGCGSLHRRATRLCARQVAGSTSSGGADFLCKMLEMTG